MNHQPTLAKTPLISVVMPTYNGGKYLHEQLDSILAQTYPNIEIIAVDDGSHDDTPSILAQYAEQGKLRYYRNDMNLGINANFERAMRLARGELIALSDQDDIWAKEKLGRLAASIGNASLIYSASALIDSDGRQLNRTLFDRYQIHALQGKPDRAFYFYNCVSGHAMLFCREILEYALPLPSATIYDQWLAYTACRLNGISYLPDSLVLHRQHHQSALNAPRIRKKKTIATRLSLHYRKEKARNRSISAHNRAISLRDFCASPLIRPEDITLLKDLAHEYERFDETFFNRRLFTLLYRHHQQLFKTPKGSQVMRCLREAHGASYVKYLPVI